ELSLGETGPRGALAVSGAGGERMAWGVIALLFAGAWAYAFYREDAFEREPLWLLAVAVVGGALSTVPALWLENRLLPGMDLEGGLAARLGAVFFVAGPVEEFCKFAAVWLLIRPRASFNE